jgi:hypothetical protein
MSVERLVKRIPDVVDADCICVERDDEADNTLLLTPVICPESEEDADAIDARIVDVALSRLADVARDPPPVRVLSVSRRVALDHTSDASDPNEVSVRVVLPHTDVAIVLEDAKYVPSTVNDLSPRMRSAVLVAPQVIIAGHEPGVPFEGTVYVYQCHPVAFADMS